MEVNVIRPDLPPPPSGLPQLPVARPQLSLNVSESPQQESTPPTASKLALRIPSKIINQSTSPSSSHPLSSPSIPTLRSNSSNQAHNKAENSATDKEVRRSVSIASFPQPPKVTKSGLDSKYSTATHSLISEATAHSKDRDDINTGSLRIKRLKTKTSVDGSGLMYSGGTNPTLIKGSGDSKAVFSTSKIRVSNDLSSLRSPPHSRSSSAQGSYSTSATTFEDTDDKRVKEEAQINRRDGAKRRDSARKEQEGKGNVIVSVRVRPDASGEKSSAKDWLVDSRQSLVAYRGREGGDYYYGELFVFCYIVLDSNLFQPESSAATELRFNFLSAHGHQLIVI